MRNATCHQAFSRVRALSVEEIQWTKRMVVDGAEALEARFGFGLPVRSGSQRCAMMSGWWLVFAHCRCVLGEAGYGVPPMRWATAAYVGLGSIHGLVETQKAVIPASGACATSFRYPTMSPQRPTSPPTGRPPNLFQNLYPESTVRLVPHHRQVRLAGVLDHVCQAAGPDHGCGADPCRRAPGSRSVTVVLQSRQTELRRAARRCLGFGALLPENGCSGWDRVTRERARPRDRYGPPR